MTTAQPLVISMHPMHPGHNLAMAEVYPAMFGTRQLKAFDITPRVKERSYAYRLQVRGVFGVSNFTVYEKFRSAEYAHFRSLTLTHIDDSGAISDQLHDNRTQLTTQGFYDHTKGKLSGPLMVIAVADVIYRVQTGKIAYALRNRPRSVCTYVEILLEDLAPYALFYKEY